MGLYDFGWKGGGVGVFGIVISVQGTCSYSSTPSSRISSVLQPQDFKSQPMISNHIEPYESTPKLTN